MAVRKKSVDKPTWTLNIYKCTRIFIILGTDGVPLRHLDGVHHRLDEGLDPVQDPQLVEDVIVVPAPVARAE